MALGAFGLAASPLARSQAALARLIHDTGCLAALGFVWRDQVVYLFHSHEAGAVRGFGNVYPVKDSSIGRLLSAPRRRRALVENADDSFSLAVPVEVGGSRLGLAIAGPDARLTAANEEHLIACARRIEDLCHEPEQPWIPPSR